MREAMEKDALLRGGMVARSLVKMRHFARHPVKSMFRRIPKEKYLPNLGREAKSTLAWPGAIAGGGVVASPLFVNREI